MEVMDSEGDDQHDMEGYRVDVPLLDCVDTAFVEFTLCVFASMKACQLVCYIAEY